MLVLVPVLVLADADVSSLEATNPDPDPDPDPPLTELPDVDGIERIDPSGERVSERSGAGGDTDRSSASLQKYTFQLSYLPIPKKNCTHHIALTHLTRSLALSAPSLSTPSLYNN